MTAVDVLPAADTDAIAFVIHLTGLPRPVVGSSFDRRRHCPPGSGAATSVGSVSGANARSMREIESIVRKVGVKSSGAGYCFRISLLEGSSVAVLGGGLPFHRPPLGSVACSEVGDGARHAVVDREEATPALVRSLVEVSRSPTKSTPPYSMCYKLGTTEQLTLPLPYPPPRPWSINGGGG